MVHHLSIDYTRAKQTRYRKVCRVPQTCVAAQAFERGRLKVDAVDGITKFKVLISLSPAVHNDSITEGHTKEPTAPYPPYPRLDKTRPLVQLVVPAKTTNRWEI